MYTVSYPVWQKFEPVSYEKSKETEGELAESEQNVVDARDCGSTSCSTPRGGALPELAANVEDGADAPLGR